MNESIDGLWIPIEVLLDKKLTLGEKLFLCEIKLLDKDKGYFKLRNEQIPLLIQANFIRDFNEQRDYSGTYCKYEEILDWEFDRVRDKENIVYNAI